MTTVAAATFASSCAVFAVLSARRNSNPTIVADYEAVSSDSFGGWPRFHAAGASRISVGNPTTDLSFGAAPREGRSAAKFTLHEGDEGKTRSWPRGWRKVGDSTRIQRAEATQLPVMLQEDEVLWYRWFTRWNTDEFPPVPAEGWRIFMQVHHDGHGVPPLAFDVKRDVPLRDGTPCAGECIVLETLDFDTRGQNGEPVIVHDPIARGLQRDAWHEFVVEVRWSSDPRKGRVRVWHNASEGDAPTVDITARTLRKNPHYLKQGYYRQYQPGTASLYHDGMVVSRTPLSPSGARTDRGDALRAPGPR